MGLKQTLSKQALKEKVGESNIFNFYFGNFELGRSYSSAFRKDDKPSTGFYVTERGNIVYNDFTTGEKYDFVAFVMKMFDVSYGEAIERIAIDFGLINGERSSLKPAIIKHIKTPKKKEEKIIKVGVCKFKKHHLDYWSQYEITEQELKDNHVYAVNNLYINGFHIPTKENELRFAYLVKDENDKEFLKIYSPYDESYKWVSSCALTSIFGLKELPFKSDTLIITKGQKDRIVLLKYFTDCISLQNESPSSLTNSVAKALKKSYKHIKIWFDQDKAGIFAANYYKETYGFEPVFTPEQAYIKHKVKDPSDFVKQYGGQIFEQYLKHIKLL